MNLTDGVNLTHIVPIKLKVVENPYPQYLGPQNLTLSVGSSLTQTLGKQAIQDNDLVSTKFMFNNSTTFPKWFQFRESDYTVSMANLVEENVGVYYGQFASTDI